MGKNGIVLVETKILNNAAVVPRGSNFFVATGLNSPVPFRPEYFENNRAVRTPSFRSTLYWNPEIHTDENGVATVFFYTADNPGKFRIVVEGITEMGERVFLEDAFEVKFEKSKND